jgi:hypothetical protein
MAAPEPGNHLLSVRAALVGFMALVIAVIAAWLTYLKAGHDVIGAVFAGAVALAGATKLLNEIIAP